MRPTDELLDVDEPEVVEDEPEAEVVGDTTVLVPSVLKTLT